MLSANRSYSFSIHKTNCCAYRIVLCSGLRPRLLVESPLVGRHRRTDSVLHDIALDNCYKHYDCSYCSSTIQHSCQTSPHHPTRAINRPTNSPNQSPTLRKIHQLNMEFFTASIVLLSGLTTTVLALTAYLSRFYERHSNHHSLPRQWRFMA